MGVEDTTKYTDLGADCTENRAIYLDTTPSSLAYYYILYFWKRKQYRKEQKKSSTEKTKLDLVNDIKSNRYLLVADKCSKHSL